MSRYTKKVIPVVPVDIDTTYRIQVGRIYASAAVLDNMPKLTRCQDTVGS